MGYDGFASAFLEDLHGARPRVEIWGCERVVVENHRGIVEYEDTLLRIRCHGCEVRITGADLTLRALSAEELAVTGVIASVEYQTGGGA